MLGLHRTAGHILGVDPAEIRPRLDLDIPRRIPEPYVCIGVQSSCQAKYWNNGHGWQIVIDDLKARGYRVLCIDKAATIGKGFVWNQLPHGAEDFTGDKPLSERIALLRHINFFIGLGSRSPQNRLGLPDSGHYDQRLFPSLAASFIPPTGFIARTAVWAAGMTSISSLITMIFYGARA